MKQALPHGKGKPRILRLSSQLISKEKPAATEIECHRDRTAHTEWLREEEGRIENAAS